MKSVTKREHTLGLPLPVWHPMGPEADHRLARSTPDFTNPSCRASLPSLNQAIPGLTGPRMPRASTLGSPKPPGPSASLSARSRRPPSSPRPQPRPSAPIPRIPRPPVRRASSAPVLYILVPRPDEQLALRAPRCCKPAPPPLRARPLPRPQASAWHRRPPHLGARRLRGCWDCRAPLTIRLLLRRGSCSGGRKARSGC